MVRRTIGSILVYAAVAASLFALAVPAAAITAEGVGDEAWAIVDTANLQNQRILDEFTAKALSAQTQEELLQYRSQARAALDSVYKAALADLKDLEESSGGTGDWTIDLAREALKSDHEAAEDEVDDLTALLLPTLPPGSTTTTTSTSTTTTTKPPVTTTTTKPPVTSTTTPSITTTTDGGSVTTTTRGVTTTTQGQTTTTTDAGAGGGTGGGGDDGSGGATDDPALAAPPVIGDATSLEARVSDRAREIREDRSMMSSVLTSSASVALPPAVVAAGVAPFIVLEVLFGTLFDSLAALVFPFLMLVIAVSVLIWRESKRPTALPRF